MSDPYRDGGGIRGNPEGGNRVIWPEQEKISDLQEKLERAVADLAACREVADGLRKDAERYRYAKKYLNIGRMHLSGEFEDCDDAAIDAAIKE